MKTTYQKPETKMFEVGNKLMVTQSELKEGVNSGGQPNVDYGGTDEQGTVIPSVREEQTFEFCWE